MSQQQQPQHSSSSTRKRGRDEEKERHRRKEEEGEDRGEKRKHRSDKKKDKHHKKHKKHSDKKHKKKDKKHRTTEETPKGSSNYRRNKVVISQDNYYDKNEEFRIWLKNKRNLYFDEIDGDTAHQLFDTFCEQWNDHSLEGEYYDGRVKENNETRERTRFKWGFAQKLDQMEMGNLRDDISRDNKLSTRPATSSSATQHRIDPRFLETQEEKEERHQEERKRGKHEEKSFRKHKEMVEEELVPKETGREARIQKNRARVAANKARENSPEVDEATLMGGSESFRSVLSRQKRRDSAKTEEKKIVLEQKLTLYQQKEEETMREFRALLQSGNVPLLQQSTRK